MSSPSGGVGVGVGLSVGLGLGDGEGLGVGEIAGDGLGLGEIFGDGLGEGVGDGIKVQAWPMHSSPVPQEPQSMLHSSSVPKPHSQFFNSHNSAAGLHSQELPAQ